MSATIEQKQKWSIAVHSAAKCRALAVDGSLPLQGDILGILGVDD